MRFSATATQLAGVPAPSRLWTIQAVIAVAVSSGVPFARVDAVGDVAAQPAAELDLLVNVTAPPGRAGVDTVAPQLVGAVECEEADVTCPAAGGKIPRVAGVHGQPRAGVQAQGRWLPSRKMKLWECQGLATRPSPRRVGSAKSLAVTAGPRPAAWRVAPSAAAASAAMRLRWTRS